MAQLPHVRRREPPEGARRRTDRGTSFGQSAVEFALTAPFFFSMLFGALDGGLFLYTRTGLSNGNTDMSAAFAAKGRDADADTYALGVLRAKGVTGSSMVSVVEVDFIKTNVDAAGTLTPASTCGGGGTTLCEQQYNVDGTTLTGGIQSWPPSSRVVSAGQSDFVQVVIKYTYKPIFYRAFNVTVTSSHYARLEPQT